MIEGPPLRPQRFQRPRRRARQKLTARDGHRSVLAALLLLLFVFAVTLSDSRVISLLTSPFRPQAQRASNDGAGDDQLRTGSILFVPGRGNVCRQKLIDNATWRIWDHGFVLCNEAVTWNAAHGRHYTATSRIETISDGFFPRR